MHKQLHIPNEDIFMEDRQQAAYKQLRDGERGPIVNVKANLKTVEVSYDLLIPGIFGYRYQGHQWVQEGEGDAEGPDKLFA